MKKIRKSLLLFLIIIISVFLGACELDTIISEENYNEKLVVHFIDVGQGDSTLIEFPNGEISLIDAGTRNNGEKVVKYLKEQGVKKIDYLIATHPHEDHIGGLPKIVKTFEIGKVYMPNRTANTRIFEELLKEMQAKDLKINIAKGGNAILDEGNLKYTILAPNRDNYENTNNYSIVTKVEYKNNSIIITGDAERESELDIINGNYNLNANILRIGNHGSDSSSLDEFIDIVNPEYYVISVGRDNTYGHPHKEVISRLEKTEGKILRTDELGDIVFISNGDEIIPVDKNNKIRANKDYFIGNKNTKVVHTKNCSHLPKEENQIKFSSLEEAIKNGYKPHEKCIKQEGVK